MLINCRLGTAVGLLLAGTFLIPGCLKRKETIRVARDGSVEFKVELEGDPGDFLSGDALPERRSGWRTRDEITTDDDGKETQTRVATLSAAAGQPLPDSYATPDDPNYATALSFPTEVLIEKRQDGTYYHFSRVYEAREHARYEIYKKIVEQSGLHLEMEGKKLEELTDEERATIVETLRMLEAFKMTEFVRAGVAALEDEWPQHFGLLLRQAVLDTFQEADMESVLALLSEPASPERDASINDFATDLIDDARSRMHQTLRAQGVGRQQIEAFDEAYTEAEAARAVTEDLNDEKWEVRVKLPGEIVAHNGIKVEEGYVVWEFSGEMLMDRDQEIRVTSRIGRGARTPAPGK